MDGTGYQAPDPYPPPGGERTRSPIVVAVVAGLVTAFVVSAFVGFFAGMGGAYLMGQRLTTGATTTTPLTTERVSGGDPDEPVEAAASAAAPAVVNIDISGEATQSGGSSGMPKGHPTVPIQGNGSGVAFKTAPNNGTYIITNNHVVESASKMMVTDAKGNRVRAKLIGRDPETDIAVIEVPRRIPTIQMANSDNVVVGSLAIAIGSPFGLEHSVTSGVVSAIHRSLTQSGNDATGAYPLVDSIQTDAAINPGNSGGPLVDRQGRLIGINTAIFTESGSSSGIGFAIPERTVVRIANELISGKGAQHPFLGILGQTVDETIAKQKKLPVNEGALVVEVTKNTNAAKSGIQKGDLIVGLDSTAIRSMDDLLLAVRRHSVGDKVTVHLYRNGKKLVLPMTVGAKPRNLSQ